MAAPIGPPRAVLFEHGDGVCNDGGHGRIEKTDHGRGGMKYGDEVHEEG